MSKTTKKKKKVHMSRNEAYACAWVNDAIFKLDKAKELFEEEGIDEEIYSTRDRDLTDFEQIYAHALTARNALIAAREIIYSLI